MPGRQYAGGAKFPGTLCCIVMALSCILQRVITMMYLPTTVRVAAGTGVFEHGARAGHKG